MRLIDANALAARLENECREWEGESAYQAGLCAAAAMVAEAPTVEQESVKPEKMLGGVWSYERCGACGKVLYERGFAYCPWCGKKVDWNAAD